MVFIKTKHCFPTAHVTLASFGFPPTAHVTLKKTKRAIQNGESRDTVNIEHMDLRLPLQSVPIPTKVVSSNLTQSEVYLIKFVSDLRQVDGIARCI
jgi:hypothetical protein